MNEKQSFGRFGVVTPNVSSARNTLKYPEPLSYHNPYSTTYQFETINETQYSPQNRSYFSKNNKLLPPLLNSKFSKFEARPNIILPNKPSTSINIARPQDILKANKEAVRKSLEHQIAEKRLSELVNEKISKESELRLKQETPVYLERRIDSSLLRASLTPKKNKKEPSNLQKTQEWLSKSDSFSPRKATPIPGLRTVPAEEKIDSLLNNLEKTREKLSRFSSISVMENKARELDQKRIKNKSINEANLGITKNWITQSDTFGIPKKSFPIPYNQSNIQEIVSNERHASTRTNENNFKSETLESFTTFSYFKNLPATIIESDDFYLAKKHIFSKGTKKSNHKNLYDNIIN